MKLYAGSHRGPYSPKDGEPSLRPHLRGSFLPSVSEPGISLRNVACRHFEEPESETTDVGRAPWPAGSGAGALCRSYQADNHPGGNRTSYDGSLFLPHWITFWSW